ncbi:MAG: hypothetical protein PVF75_09640, partial [Granulosicoccaceae bacterium]
MVAIDRRLNPYRHRQSVIVRDTPVEVWWTDRAERALAQRDTPLTAEMQLYFSCVVKKRVLFHEQSELEGIPVDSRLQILFRPVESTSCDPEEFAHDFPVKREFQSPAARKLKPAVLEIDYRHGI